MDLYEYQAKHLFGKHGVPVVPGAVCETPDAARLAARRIGGTVVVKAQVKVGGRGKAGGVKLADGEDEASARAADILGMDIKGHTVHKVLVTEAAEIAEEYYVSFLLDRANRTFLAMASVEGGVEIEQVAKDNPEALAMIRVDALEGCPPEKAREIVAAAKFPADVADAVADVLVKLWVVLVEEDATLVEVNPLVKTTDGRVLALDGKVSLDENAHFRHASHADLVDTAATRTPSSCAPRRSTSTTSSSTARSGSSATAPAWSCPPWTSWPTPVRSSAGCCPPTSSTSAAVRAPR